MHVRHLRQGLAHSQHPLMFIITAFPSPWSQAALAGYPNRYTQFIFSLPSSSGKAEKLNNICHFPWKVGEATRHGSSNYVHERKGPENQSGSALTLPSHQTNTGSQAPPGVLVVGKKSAPIQSSCGEWRFLFLKLEDIPGRCTRHDANGSRHT